MNSSIIPFAYNESLVRAQLDEKANPWFLAKDVCDCLELENVSRSCDILDEDEKGIRETYTLGGMQKMLFINEPGLYTLIFRSNKERAKEFRRWVTHEVLPQLNKSGQYTMPGVKADSEEGMRNHLNYLMSVKDPSPSQAKLIMFYANALNVSKSGQRVVQKPVDDEIISDKPVRSRNRSELTVAEKEAIILQKIAHLGQKATRYKVYGYAFRKVGDETQPIINSLIRKKIIKEVGKVLVIIEEKPTENKVQ